MRFVLTRIFKNFPFIYKYWLNYLECSDARYFDKICHAYKIIPMGNHCLPRVITTLNRLKPPKKYGELSFPFDLCFSDFVSNVKLVDSDFKDFFDDMEFDTGKNAYVSKKHNCIFNHDQMPFEDFKKRYLARIDNFFKAVADTSKHVFFLVATYQQIENKDLEFFVSTINKYRDFSTYSIIIVNQSNKQIAHNLENVYCIDLFNDKTFGEINKNGDWAGELKRMKNPYARKFNAKIAPNIAKIIRAVLKRCCTKY